MTSETKDADKFEPWYKYGVAILYIEMILAIALTIFALSLTFSGAGGISKR